MITNNNSQIIKPLDLLSLCILSSYPLALISGNFLINMFIFLFSINFLVNFKENRKFLKDKVFYLLLFFFISLLINLFFSSNPENSFPRVFKILFIIIFIFEIKKLIQNYGLRYIKYVYTSWFVIFLILTLDIIFEIIFGYNTIGNQSYMPGRISSFFGDELVAGAFYHGFVLFFLSYLIFQNSKIYILAIAVFAVLLISFLIGERSNFIKSFISIFVFAALAIKVNYKLKLFVIIIFLITFVTIINSNKFYKVRYFEQVNVIYSINGLSKYLKASDYGAQQNAAIKILKDNIYFGVGIKNFRYEAGKKKYENKEYISTNKRASTHPHQVHHEFLSETGIFGYLSFVIFFSLSLYVGIKRYLLTKNLYQLSSIIFICTSLLPIIPSGSFLSTYASGIFWLNFAIMISYLQKPKS